MPINRRRLFALGAVAAGATFASSATAASALPTGSLGLDATHFGLRPGSPDDQSRPLQRAVEAAARAGQPLAIPPGRYRVSGVKLPAGAQLIGVRGATRLMLNGGPSLVSAENADRVTLSGLVLDGSKRPLPDRRGLAQFENCRGIKIADCEVVGSGRNGIVMVSADGELVDTRFADIADAAIQSLDARGLLIARNTIASAGNNGIQVWRTERGDDSTIVTDNRIEGVDNRSGGSGQYGNAVNVFRAANVIVRGNRIKNCAFSAVRGNAASNIHIEGNSIKDVGEVALYSEFGFEGALIAGNSVDGAAIGISVTNFNEGGRLAVVQGNIIRNLLAKRPPGTDPGDGAGIGIAVEADTAVTGNVVELAPTAGLMLGFGRYLRDVAATGNVVRKADIGIAVSVSPGAGNALIANNIIADVLRGAIVGLDGRRIVTGDLLNGGSERYAHLSISGNRVR
jgi:uncharacterized secreted repeat protein (TIGR03808 family)